MLRPSRAAGELVGREEELAVLMSLLERARHGRGAIALVAGEAGIGKTRLCRELKHAAAQTSTRVIEGRSFAAERAVPYGPFMDALRFRLARGEGDAAAQVLQPVLAKVAPFFKALTESGGEVADAGFGHAPFDLLFTVFQRLAAIGPVLLVLEDLHWADPTSRDLLQFIAQRIGTLGILIVATYRTDEIHSDHPVQLLASTLSREPSAARIHLDALTQADTRKLLEQLTGVAVSQEVTEAFYRRTEGNPLFIEELASVVQSSGGGLDEVTTQQVERARASATLQDVVWERLSGLSEPAREALTVASVVGRVFDLNVLQAVLGWQEDDLLRATEELLRHNLIVEERSHREDSYSFRHSVMQEVVYASLIGRRRRNWHRRIAEVMEASDDAHLSHTVLAYHYTAGGNLERARAHTIRAADEAAGLFAWRDAESMYEEALAALEREGGDHETELDILEKMTEVAWWQGKLNVVEQYANDALQLCWRLGHRKRAVALQQKLAKLNADQKDAVELGVEQLQHSLALLDKDDVRERALIFNDLGRLSVKRGEWREARVLFESSLALRPAGEDCSEEALALAMLGSLSVHEAKIETGWQRLEIARALMHDHTVHANRTADVYHAGIRALEAAREHQRARIWVTDAIAYADRRGAVDELMIYRAYEAAIRRRAGEWQPALASAHEVVSHLRTAGRAELREALRIVGDLKRGLGDISGARRAYREAADLDEISANVGLAILDVVEKRAAVAIRTLETALASRPAEDVLFRLRVYPLLIEAMLEHGDASSAERVLGRFRHDLEESDYRAGAAALAESAARVAHVRGDRAAAAQQLRLALSVWEELALPFELARTKLLLAQELMSYSRGKAEAAFLAEAAALSFDELGARLDSARARMLLRQQGIRRRAPRRSETAGPGALNRLTRREADVLREIARGRTNRQIGEMLSLSTRTIENHVASVLAKLKCATRTEAARIAFEARD